MANDNKPKASAAELSAFNNLLAWLLAAPGRSFDVTSFNITNDRGAVAVSALDSTKMHAHVAVGEDVAGCIIAALNSPAVPLEKAMETLSDDLKALRAELDARS